MNGRVVFIGAGPGSVDLITLRGARRLAEADIVLADALIDPGFRALAPRARWIDVGKRGYGPATAQGEIDALLAGLAAEHRTVVRLKGGDPSVFGRLEEELEALAGSGAEIEIVPGVTAALAAAADAKRPLTRRGAGRSVALTTAVTKSGEVEARRGAETEVFYMAGRRLPALARELAAAGWPLDTPVVVVSNAGRDDAIVTAHRVGTLGHGSVIHAGRPTVVTVGCGARPVGGSETTGERAPRDEPARMSREIVDL